MNGDLKQTFITQCLENFLADAKKAMEAAIRRYNVGVTGEGLASISYEVLKDASGGEAKLSFNDYLRFVDMGVGRAHPLGGLDMMTVALSASHKKGIKQVKDMVRRPKKMYSKPSYAQLGHLYGKLLYGYTEETIAILKQQMQDGTGSNPA